MVNAYRKISVPEMPLKVSSVARRRKGHLCVQMKAERGRCGEPECVWGSTLRPMGWCCGEITCEVISRLGKNRACLLDRFVLWGGKVFCSLNGVLDAIDQRALFVFELNARYCGIAVCNKSDKF